jgi:nucleoid-associated protein YgaU
MMMKNRASLLALFVLAIATVLMVFFILPQIGKNEKPLGEAINQASSEVKNALANNTGKATDAAQNSGDKSTGPAQQLAGLAATAATSLGELKALFSDGKDPSSDIFAASKAKAVDALQAIVDFAAPPGADPATTALVDKAHDGAGKALAIILALPKNIADAAAATDRAAALVAGTATADIQQADKTPIMPAFDILRVEPDGSTVIAGSAEPGAELQIMDGEKVVTTVKVGPGGDFAAVLDNPLPAGDHELVLKAIGKDGTAIMSQEVATVSVPKDDKSQLLAMVSKPGKASRIITAPTAKASRVASAEPSAVVTDADGAAAPKADDSHVASAEPAATLPSATPAQMQSGEGAPDVMVNAVEIENDHIFVAGTSRPNAKIRAYADDKLIGEIVAGADGHFVVDGEMPLAVGDHKIRVDVMEGETVRVRTTVNFNRPEGNQVTVAAQTPANAASSVNAALVPLDEGELGKLKDNAGKAFGLLKGLFVNSKEPGAEELAAARSATEIALKSLGEFRPAADASIELKNASADASSAAAKALAFLRALPKDAKSVSEALPKLDQMIAAVVKPLAKVVPTPATAETASNGGQQPKTFQQAPLAESSGAIIIRHGDTLWQISRRIYGQGVRYTTIYLANQDKISNPDHILPGQVFGLPEKALPNAEELHRKRMSGQRL